MGGGSMWAWRAFTHDELCDLQGISEPEMQYRTRVRNSACNFCNIVGVKDLHGMLIRLSKSDLLVDSRSYTLFFRKPQRKKSRGLRSGDRGGYSC
ncbi:hypothetical protein TNCV_2301111 [Trichonephila clavipes]|nr:hypothetical protein TNCV_2301111 [Trichonephila clavipes]